MTTTPITLLDEQLADTIHRYDLSEGIDVDVALKNGVRYATIKNVQLNQPLWQGAVTDTESLTFLSSKLSELGYEKHTITGSFTYIAQWVDSSDDVALSANLLSVSDDEITELKKELQALVAYAFDEYDAPFDSVVGFIDVRAAKMGPETPLDEPVSDRKTMRLRDLSDVGQEISFQIAISPNLPVTMRILEEIKGQLEFSSDVFPSMERDSLNLVISKAKFSSPMLGMEKNLLVSVADVMSLYSQLEPNQIAMKIAMEVASTVGFTAPLQKQIQSELMKRDTTPESVVSMIEENMTERLLKGLPAPIQSVTDDYAPEQSIENTANTFRKEYI